MHVSRLHFPPQMPLPESWATDLPDKGDRRGGSSKITYEQYSIIHIKFLHLKHISTIPPAYTTDCFWLLDPSHHPLTSYYPSCTGPPSSPIPIFPSPCMPSPFSPFPLPHLEQCLFLAREVLGNVLLPAVVHLFLNKITVVEMVEQIEETAWFKLT